MKRLLDLFVFALALPILLPVILVTALMVWFGLGSPIFYSQLRGGYKGRQFALYKFRSMTDERDAAGNLIADELRLTRLGRFLRGTSLDELPCFWNVLTGNLSLVGPRPFMAKYLTRYTAEQMRRHDVVPGITGWAQVNGRNAITWEEKFELDVWYVDNRSIGLDLKILAMTVMTVLSRRGTSAVGEATMPEFMGTAEK